MVFDVTLSETAVAVHNSTDNENILIGQESDSVTVARPFEAHRTSGYRDNFEVKSSSQRHLLTGLPASHATSEI